MNKPVGYWRVLITLALAMCLRIAPWPLDLSIYNPDWVLMTLIYWSLTFPERFGIFHAWTIGLFTDVLTGRLIGEYTLVYSLVVYICLKLHKRILAHPLIQQLLFILVCLFLSHIIIFLVENLQHPAQLHVSFWYPVLSGTFLWPLVYSLLQLVRFSERSK
jgi:rod shape-determining protein MreD